MNNYKQLAADLRNLTDSLSLPDWPTVTESADLIEAMDDAEPVATSWPDRIEIHKYLEPGTMLYTAPPIPEKLGAKS